MKITAAGLGNNNTGIGVAFDRHVKALETVADVEIVDITRFHFNDESVFYAHGGPSAVASALKQAKRSPRRIAYLVCESTKLTTAYFEAARHCDEIWTCSHFCKSVFDAELKVPVKVVPHYAELFDKAATGNTQPVFLVAFNAHSRSMRKHPLLSVLAIKSAVPDAKIIVKALNASDSLIQGFNHLAGTCDLEFITEPLASENVLDLYNRVDILVSLHASEGFGLHLLEAMALGKRVVATRFGGNVDFMQEDNSFLVDYTLVKTTDDWFKGQWALPDLDSAVTAVKAACTDFNDPTVTSRISASARYFDFDNTCLHTQKALL